MSPYLDADGPAARSADRPRALNRRALFTGGLLGAGGIAGLMVAGPAGAATAATAASAGPVVYGPPPSAVAGDDDTPALFAAISTMTNGGTLLLPPGTYHLRSLLYVSSRIDIQGSGGGYAGLATVLQCMTAAAGVHVWGGGGVTGNFTVDANSIATTPFTRGYEGSAVGRTFAALSVVHSAGDGVTCLGGQNDAWYLLTVSNAARDCLVLDQGYGGALFSKCEIANGGRFNLRIDKQVPGGPYAAPSDNVFHQCIVEYNQAGSQSIAYINGGWATKFDHTSFFASNKTTGPVIDVLGGTTELAIEDAAIQSTGSTLGGLGLRVDYGTQVTLSGTTHFQNLDAAIYVQKSASAPATAPWVDIQGLPLYYACTKHIDSDANAIIPGLGVERFVSNFQIEPIQSRRNTPDDAAYVSRLGNDAYPTVTETAAGRRTWGPGGANPGDVALGRRAAGVLGVDANNLFATGYGSAAARPPAAAGAIRLNTDSLQLEVSDGSAWYAPTEHARTLTASGTFVVPAGVSAIRTRAVGGGGGGGGAGNIGATSSTKSCFGGAGGGAGMLVEQVLSVRAGDTLAITVGAGGAGGTGAAVASGLVGQPGRPGAAGAMTAIRINGGADVVQAPGGGGGTAGPGATSRVAVAPGSGGAFGCADVANVVAPGCGSFAGAGVIPAPGGVCGGASGGPATTTAGGGAGTAPALPGQRATAGTASSPTKNGLAGATPTAPGCGGNGGGAGGKGGTGGAGGAGSNGRVDLWWVA